MDQSFPYGLLNAFFRNGFGYGDELNVFRPSTGTEAALVHTFPNLLDGKKLMHPSFPLAIIYFSFEP